MNTIVTCGCGNTKDFVKLACKIISPDEEQPIIIEKPDDEFKFMLNTHIKIETGKTFNFAKPYALWIRNDGRYNRGTTIYNLLEGYKIC